MGSASWQVYDESHDDHLAVRNLELFGPSNVPKRCILQQRLHR